MNLKTKTVTEPLGDVFLSGAEMSGDLLLYWVVKPEGIKFMEWNMETGEQTEFSESGGYVFWSEDTKVITTFSEPGDEFWTYRCQDDGTCELLRQGKREEAFLPVAKSGSLLLGRMWGKTGGFSALACMEQEDYLAGKTNWTIVTEEK